MKKKILLLICGVSCFNSISAFSSENGNWVVKSFVLNKTELDFIKRCFTIKPSDINARKVIEAARNWYKQNPGELNEMLKKVRQSCWFFNVAGPMTQATLFSHDVRLNIVESNITGMDIKISTLESTLFSLGDQIAALPKAEENQYIKDLESMIQAQQKQLAKQAKTISDLQSKLQEQEGKQRSLDERLLKLEGQVQTQQTPSVEIENLDQEFLSIRETVGRLELQLKGKVDKVRFDVFKNLLKATMEHLGYLKNGKVSEEFSSTYDSVMKKKSK